MIEIMRFRLRPGVDAAAFRAVDARLQTEFAYRQPGLLRRTVARGDDGGYVVIDLWRAAADADACAGRWEEDPVARAFMDTVDGASVEVSRYTELDG